MKVFSCPKCGCKRFTLVKRSYTDVDFSQEGAIGGRLAISKHLDDRYECFLCYECGEEVPAEQAELMLAEVM